MGYCMDQRDSDFRITKKNKEKALEVVRESLINNWPPKFGYSWIDLQDIEQAETLEELFHACRWYVEKDKDDNINRIIFCGEKLGDDLLVFNCFAPFVEDGSYIEMVGEDGELWRWVFDGEKCTEETPQIVWP